LGSSRRSVPAIPPYRRTAWCAALSALAAATPARAQTTDVEAIGRALSGAVPPPGYYETLRQNPDAFQFSRNNGFILRARNVAATRSALRSQGALLSAEAAAAVVEGELNVPVFLILYAGTDSASLVANVSRATVQDRLYGTTLAPPYSVHTFYREISDDRLLVNGTVLEWTRVDSAATYYEGNCNGLCSGGAVDELIEEMVALHDDDVDFSQFDSDGDGVVDAVVLIHPELDGACGQNNNIWAHRFSYGGWTNGGRVQTNDGVTVNDYIIQGGQGGDAGCTANQPVAMGVVAHETGHLFGLPDLYAVGNGVSEGIGHWGLMGAGNWRLPSSPAYMEAWSRGQLGWLTEVPIERDTTLDLTPVQASDTAFVLAMSNTEEYFLLENRQPLGPDVNLWGPGLLIWHVDPARIIQRAPTNQVNSFSPEGLALEQSDGRGDLLLGNNRGDGGDPFPGSLARTVFSHQTNPSSARNDGTQTFIIVDSVEQLTPEGAVRVRIRYGVPSLIAAADTLAAFRLNGTPMNRLEDVLVAGDDYDLEMDDVQVANDGRNRYTWVSWSNGQPRSHTFTASPGGDTITAVVDAEFRVRVNVFGVSGEVTSDPPAADLATGEFVAENGTITLTAELTDPTMLFDGWTGDTTAVDPTLVLVVTRPLDVTATFVDSLVAGNLEPAPVVAGGQYRHQFSVAGGRGAGSYLWVLEDGTVPAGLQFLTSGVITGVTVETGEFPLTISVGSGNQRFEQDVVLSVVTPALVLDEVVNHLVGTDQRLTANETRFLDLIGNGNGRFDVGDFLAWLDAGGMAISAERMAELLRAAAPKRGTP